MGYTHFWYRPKILDKKRYAGFAILAAVLRDIAIKGGNGEGDPTVTKNDIRFNGYAAQDLDHETFAVPRVLKPKSSPPDEETGLYLNHCKTNFKPYDVAVVAC